MRMVIIQHICCGVQPSSQIVLMSFTNDLHRSLLPSVPCSSSSIMPVSHSFMCSARMPETPPALPLRNPLTTSLNSASSGVSLLTGKLSMLIGIGSLGDQLLHTTPLSPSFDVPWIPSMALVLCLPHLGTIPAQFAKLLSHHPLPTSVRSTWWHQMHPLACHLFTMC